MWRELVEGKFLQKKAHAHTPKNWGWASELKSRELTADLFAESNQFFLFSFSACAASFFQGEQPRAARSRHGRHQPTLDGGRGGAKAV